MPDTPRTPGGVRSSRRPGGRGVGSRSPSFWRCSTWPPACSCGSKPAPLRFARRCRGARPPLPGLLPGDIVLRRSRLLLLRSHRYSSLNRELHGVFPRATSVRSSTSPPGRPQNRGRPRRRSSVRRRTRPHSRWVALRRGIAIRVVHLVQAQEQASVGCLKINTYNSRIGRRCVSYDNKIYTPGYRVGRG